MKRPRIPSKRVRNSILRSWNVREIHKTYQESLYLLELCFKAWPSIKLPLSSRSSPCNPSQNSGISNTEAYSSSLIAVLALMNARKSLAV